ncbi:hypothetical protein GE061_006211 [Apolygus lucorum]|uniref:G-protein coupled receptors family 1 profile domain-containing protein n=1 Tax=Apolygus lucorum TaxID=248454 RepID=A0A8S9WTA3_APOLU|nr:hypothetical protein GE061_006211 [Apolygus lucorum]
MIICVWSSSLIWNVPILFVSRLKAMRDQKRQKCREEWPNPSSERAYNLFLDCILLLVPLLIMSLAYILISSKLWRGLQRELRHNSTHGLQHSKSIVNQYEIRLCEYFSLT